MIGGNAWAGDKTVVKYSFDDANSPAVTAGSRVSLDYTKTSAITSTAFLNAWNSANGDPGASTISLGSTDLSAETWTLSFEWAAVGGCNSKPDHTTLKAGDTNLFDLSGNSNWNTTVTLSVAGAATATTLPVPGCDKSKRFTANTGDQMNTTTYWHHFVITGSSDGVKMTITKSNSGEAIVTDVVLSETNVNPTDLVIEPCCGGAIGIDELSLTYYVEGEVIQTPTAAYTAVDGINRTITATCDTEGATLYYSTDGENWTEGASVTINASGNVLFKAVKNTSESDVLTFAAEAGTEIVLNAPVIVRNANGTVTISNDQSKLLLAPTATIYYTYGEENGSFTGSKELTVAADATITAYAEADGYAKSADATRAVALFPENVNTLFSVAAATKGWSANAFNAETITASERTYATLLLDEAAWSENVLFQTDGAWGLRASGNWYINSNTDNSWLLVKDTKAGNIIVVDATFAPAETVNATYAEKYSFGTKHAYTIAADGNAEFALIKPAATEMDYFYGVYGYSLMTEEEIAILDAKDALQEAITAAEAIETEGKKGVDALTTAIADAKTALNAAEATVESLSNAKTALADAVTDFEAANAPIYIETDLTAQFNSLANTQWTGSSGQVGWAAPKVTTNSGLEVAAWERYNGSCDWTGEIMSSSVTGLTPGTYKIELYGAAAFTFGRGFGSTDFTGDFSKDASDTYHENDAITENTGVTLFAETSEGTVSKEIPIWYATNFNTSGIATATLENVVVGETGTIKIGLSKTSTSTNWHVVQLKGVTAQVDAVELHANELAAAQAALNAEENAIVTGEEKTALETAISENTTVAEQTADAYKAAIKALSDATAAFTGAKAAYEEYAAAQAYLVDLPYADAAKKPAAEAATNAADATAKAEALMVALRAYYESAALAENVAGAKVMTDSIKNPKAEDGINNWTVVLGEGSGGNIDVKSNEPWTDAAGVAEHKYFDGGDWGAQAWDVALEQKINLPAGKYQLTTIARASGDVDFTLYAGADSVKIAAIGAAGGMFNRGWNNAAVEFEMAEADSIVIGVRGVTKELHNWMSFSDFRLVQLEEKPAEPIYIETDLTAQFNSLANTQWTGSSGQVGWAAPKVTTNSGLEVAAWERYNGSCDWTGEIMSSSVTGLTPGTYKIELYGAAAFTFGRGFGSTDFTGDFSKDASDTYHENDAITENTGVTLFAETSEGTVSKEIPIWYATNFNTSGIATATLENVVVGETGTIKIGLSKTSTSTNWHVVQLKGVTAQVDAVELHANELAAAQAALNAEENAIVTGEEKTALETAISENSTVAEQTADAYKAAIKALSDATAAFKDAKAAYQTLADAKEEITMIGYDARFPYASDAKKQAAAATLSAEPANAEDATAKAAAIYKAYRQFAESNAMLEGVEGAVNMTNLIVNPAAEEAIAEPWVVESQSSNGSMGILSNEPWTDGEDNSTHKYFDGYAWDQNAWDATMKQEITLPAGKYLLTVKSRASEAVNLTLFAGIQETGMPSLGATGGLFNRGWNDSSLEFELNEESTITIGVKGETEEVHNWMSFSDFRLVQFPAKVQPELPEGVIYSWESPEGTPVEMGGTIAYVNGDGDRLNYLNSGYYTICLNGKKANLNDEVASANAGHMVITLDEAVAEGDTIAITGYITKNSSSKSSAWIVFENGATAESAVFGDESNIFVPEGGEATGAINTKDVVVSAEAAGSKTITLTRGQTGTNLFITKLQIKKANVVTGINFVKAAIEDGSVYNLNGQKVNKAKKGLYIINGKKVVIK